MILTLLQLHSDEKIRTNIYPLHPSLTLSIRTSQEAQRKAAVILGNWRRHLVLQDGASHHPTRATTTRLICRCFVILRYFPQLLNRSLLLLTVAHPLKHLIFLSSPSTAASHYQITESAKRCQEVSITSCNVF